MGGESVVSEAEAFASELWMDPNITLKVVLDGVSLVKQLPWVDSKRLYLYGFSRGAFFAALLASRLDGIEGGNLALGSV